MRGTVGFTLALLRSTLLGGLLLLILALSFAGLLRLLTLCLTLILLFLIFLAHFLPATAAFALTLRRGDVGGSNQHRESEQA